MTPLDSPSPKTILEPKIMTLSYTQPKLPFKELLNFPLRRHCNFFRFLRINTLNINFKFFNPKKAHPCASFEPSHAKICRRVWPVGELTKKRYMDSYKNFCVYFTHLPGSPPWRDLHEILHEESSRRRNQSCQILSQSDQGVLILWRVEFLAFP